MTLKTLTQPYSYLISESGYQFEDINYRTICINATLSGFKMQGLMSQSGLGRRNDCQLCLADSGEPAIEIPCA